MENAVATENIAFAASPGSGWNWLGRSDVALTAILVLNVLDALFTLLWVGGGMATEANPLMAPLLANPLQFFWAKISIVTAAVLFLGRYQKLPLARLGTHTAFAAYLAVFLLHLGFGLVRSL